MSDEYAKTELTDITERFISACKTHLQPGELLHAPHFILHNVMGAFEIMDPKIDACMKQSRSPPLLLETIKKGQLFLGIFSDTSELVGIMDELLTSTINWLCGDALIQTVFICCYMHCTQLIKDPRLRIFCEMLRRLVFFLRSLIISAQILHEEDHHQPTYDLPLCGPDPLFDEFMEPSETGNFFTVPPDKMTLSELSQCVSDLQGEKSNTDTKSDDLERAIHIRLEFILTMVSFSTKLYLHFNPSCELDLDDEVAYVPLPNCHPSISREEKVENECDAKLVPNFWPLLNSLTHDILPQLSRLSALSLQLISTMSVGKLPGPGKADPEQSEYGLNGFEPLLNVTKILPFMPRYVLIYDRLKSLNYISNTFSELYDIVEWLYLLSSSCRGRPFHQLWATFQHIGQTGCADRVTLSKTTNPSSITSCVLTRSLLRLLYLGQMQKAFINKSQLVNWQKQSFMSSWLQCVPDRFHRAIDECIEGSSFLCEFVCTLSEYLYQIPHLYCLNRARQRDSLHELIYGMPNILAQCPGIEHAMNVNLTERTAENAVNPIPPPPCFKLTAYCQYIYCHLAWDFLISGFQLELYGCNELPFLYMFLFQLGLALLQLSTRLSTALDLDARSDRVGRSDSTIDENTNHTDGCDKNKRKSKKCGRKKHQNIGSYGCKNDHDTPDLLRTPGQVFWSLDLDYEVNILHCHQSLTLGTLYAIRALQLDAGQESFETTQELPILSQSINLDRACSVFNNRLGLFFRPENAPFAEQGGAQEVFESCRRRLDGAGVLSDASHIATTKLYLTAALQFGKAHKHAEIASNQCQNSGFNHPHIMSFGPPDRLPNLIKLASHNMIACRVLSTAPDRRPNKSATNKRIDFLLDGGGPVLLDFNFLTSRTYPLVKLVSSTSQSEDVA